LSYIFFNIALYIGIIPLLILLLKKRIFDFKEPIAPFIWVTAFATFYEFFGSVIFKVNAAYWYQVYSSLEIITLFYFFFKLYALKYKNLLWILIISFIVIYGLSFFFWTDESVFIPNAINKTALTFFVLTFSFLWFRKLFKKMEIPNPLENSNFYFVSGLSIYYSSTFFLFLFAEFIFNSNVYFQDYWLINILATFILRTFLILGVWKMKSA